ncbi:hypothetical protein AB4865_11860 [Capnocytophaga sp. ARDL2]|uniref:hypothetical protein n=1 Tax=Capnocytophaga sp. ARDL2 TaxID=3238809 RepID=UPI0035592CC1
MKTTEILISIIDRIQTVYEWFLKMFGHLVEMIKRVKEIVLDFIDFVKDLMYGKEDVQSYLKNYNESEHFFI